MPHTTELSAAERNAETDCGETEDFTTLVAEMVADQAPRVFAIVLEYGHQIDAQVVAWGMAVDEHAFVVTTDGKNHYVLAEPENALRYLAKLPHTTPHLVWATPAARE